MSKILKRKYLIYAAYFLLLTLQSQMLFSQSKFTVLLPKTDTAIPAESDKDLRIAADGKGQETAKSFFKFDFNNLPINAKVAELYLKLYVRPDKIKSGNASQTITILNGNNDWTGKETKLDDAKLSWARITIDSKPIGRTKVTQSSKSIITQLDITKSLELGSKFLYDGVLSLAARSPQKIEDTKFFSSITSETATNFSKKPKLIVTYEVSAYPFREDWAQPFANSQHNSLQGWKTNTYTTSAQLRKLLKTENENIQDGGVLIYKNQPVIFTQPTTGKAAVFYVKQLNSRGDVLWSAGVDAAAKYSPLIDEQGRLYYISESGKLTVLDLNNKGESLFSKSLSDITGGQIKVINNNVTIGYDGTIYVPSDQGLLALSAYPQFKIRWKYEQKLNEINGPISLSPDESKAFFINVDKNNKKSRLIILDNMDGSLIAASGYDLGGYYNDPNYYIPSPVVQNNSRVFVLNGFDNGNKLFVFDINDKKEIKTQFISSGNTVNTGISQPVIDGAEPEPNVFFVYNEKLAKYDALNNRAIEFTESATLNNASILVTDNSSNIYAIDPYSDTKKVMGFRNDAGSPNTFSVNIDNQFQNPRKNIVLAPDGTLYNTTATNIISITPLKVASSTINLSNLSTNTVYRASDAITVEEFSVIPTINTILNSGGSISFKPGFSVKKGAQLTCKTGF